MSQLVSRQTDGLQVSFAGEEVVAECVDFVMVRHENFQVDGVLEQIWFERCDLQ